MNTEKAELQRLIDGPVDGTALEEFTASVLEATFDSLQCGGHDLESFLTLDDDEIDTLIGRVAGRKAVTEGFPVTSGGTVAEKLVDDFRNTDRRQQFFEQMTARKLTEGEVVDEGGNGRANRV